MAGYCLLTLRLNKYVSAHTKFSMQVYLAGLLHGDSSDWIHTHHLYDSDLNRIRQWNLIYIPPMPEKSLNAVLDKIFYACARYAHAWPVEFQGGIVILHKAYEEFDYEKLYAEIGQEQRIIVSEPFTDLKLIRNHLHACQRTGDLSVFDESEANVIFVENYKMPIAYLCLKQMPNGMTLYHPAIDRIRQHDAHNNTNYLETLRTYLLHEMNYQKTADRLFVHKNTVIYRIQRIEELFFLNLHDCRVLTALYLSFLEEYQRFREEDLKDWEGKTQAGSL